MHDQRQVPLGPNLIELAKSALPAGLADESGVYPFFCSSPEPKAIGQWLVDGEAVVLGTGGVASVNFGRGKFAYSTDCWAIQARKGELSTEYLYRVLQHWLPKIDYAGFEGSGLRHLRKDFIRKLEVRVPDDRVQEKAVRILAALDDAIEQTEALIEKTEQIKAGLVHDLFTRGVTSDGQLRPPREQAQKLYKESPLGWIPTDWGVDEVDGFCSSVVDCPHSTPEYIDEGVPCIRTADMVPGELLLDQAYRVSEKVYGERTTRLALKKGDIIYSREGERLGIASPVGDVRVCLGQRVMALRPGPCTDPSFLMFAMNTERFYRSVVSGLGATTSPHVNVGDIRAKLLPRPREDEQVRIGLALTAVHQQLRASDTARAKLRNLQNGLMHDLLTGFVRAPRLATEVVAA